MERSRAAILPFPGDPFLLSYWLKYFNEVWGDEVDKLYIYLNSTIEAPVVDYIKELCASNPKINLQYQNHQIEHGDCIDRTLDIVTEKHVMLIEDDAFIFKKGIVDGAFKKLESGEAEIVGSKRGSCAFSILQAAREKWNIDYEGLGDQGCNFWPCYFFCSKELLLKTDRNFKAKAWNRGDVVPGIEMIVTEDVIYGDTFVNTSLQLRALVPESKIIYLPQYHGSPDDTMHYEKHQYLFDGYAPWTHIGSLSTGVGGILQDEFSRPLAARKVLEAGKPTQLDTQYCQSEGEHKEFERRVQWWLTFWEKAGPLLDPMKTELQEFYTLYGKAVNRIIEQYGLNISNIRQRQRIYAKLGL